MKFLLALPALVSLVSGFCDHGTTLRPRSLDKRVDVAEYGFHETDGALGWHGLDEDYHKCAKGKKQSPINIYSNEIATVAGSTLSFSVDSYPSGAEFLNLGSTVEVIANGTLVRQGKTFSLAQFHFHTPSEHHVDGEHYPVEVHFVFQAAGEQHPERP